MQRAVGTEGAALADCPRERVGFRLFVGQLMAIFGIALSYALLALALVWSWRCYGGGLWRRLRDGGGAALVAPLGIYALLYAAACLTSPELRTSLGNLWDIVALSALPLALLFVRGEQRARAVTTALIVMGVGFALWGLVQLLVFGGVLLERRIHGPFSHYQTYAGVLLLCDLLVVVRLVYWKRAGHRLLLWFAFVLISVALVFGLTRGAWVALAVAVIVLLVVRAPRLLLPAGVATLLAALVVPLPVLARVASITDLQDISNYDRLCMGYSGLLMIADRPLLGVGPDVVEKLYPIYRHPTAPKLQRPHLHNSFLQIAAAVGLPALGAFLWLLAASATIAWRSYRAEGGAQGPRADLYVAALVGLCAFAVAGLFEDNWGDSEVQRVFLFLLALPVCARFGARGASPDTPVVAPEGLAS